MDTAVKLSETIPALVSTWSRPTAVSATVGVNLTTRVQEAPAASVVPQVVDDREKSALPMMLAEVGLIKLMALAVVLVRVAVAVGLVPI